MEKPRRLKRGIKRGSRRKSGKPHILSRRGKTEISELENESYYIIDTTLHRRPIVLFKYRSSTKEDAGYLAVSSPIKFDFIIMRGDEIKERYPTTEVWEWRTHVKWLSKNRGMAILGKEKIPRDKGNYYLPARSFDFYLNLVKTALGNEPYDFAMGVSKYMVDPRVLTRPTPLCMIEAIVRHFKRNLGGTEIIVAMSVADYLTKEPEKKPPLWEKHKIWLLATATAEVYLKYIQRVFLSNFSTYDRWVTTEDIAREFKAQGFVLKGEFDPIPGKSYLVSTPLLINNHNQTWVRPGWLWSRGVDNPKKKRYKRPHITEGRKKYGVNTYTTIEVIIPTSIY